MSRRTWIAASTVGALALAAAVTVHLLSAPTYSFAAAPLAGDPACARVGERYPDRLAGLERSDTTTEGAAVWGDGAVVARCGFPRLGATDDACTQVDGVDWAWRTSTDDDGREVLVTYGREPSVEVQLTVGEAAPDAVLVGLSPVVRHLGQDNECLAPSDVTAPTTPPHHTH
ncbi:DUF3515 family protein [Streptomyces sp. LBUM 1478]|uniref:Putative secreted protein n=1 Tax=Streptomyces scabiei (strain 87.22) TaxID=680198 RepID=C9Z8P3_STRSW|nr:MULTISPECIES: DUF3515 family protein [Streptomyces]MBP5862491.1 DUF3515 family protein [Streptomyces sp. LBUM 1484]MBP5868559.1 DUF3515 family protein [Streptomyces sp. LBUM 1485]MBP5907113.1 DUF3515 family protein [Streptomyces sp. LBUM 1478]MBP5930045.1 DUF3515 family protein [Streptomyces sp. LBUM 1479]MBP5884880.1 DUF3515 family protein [Streptomyces sp. LBUM 1487]